MYSVFSSSLVDYTNTRYRKQSTTIKDALMTVKQDHIKDCFMSNVLIVNSQSDEIANEILYTISTSKDLRRILAWINKNLVIAAPKLRYETRWVKVRIATDMLNKLVYEGVLTKDLNIEIHSNLVQNVEELASDLYEEDLPF